MRYVFLFLIGLFSVPMLTLANIDHSELQHPKEVLNNLQESYGEELCNKASSEDWELLGESFMQAMAGSDEQHEWMDDMHGGEGSKELMAFHIFLGKRYANCDTDNDFSSGPMMIWGGSNWNGNYHRGYGMMNNDNWFRSGNYSPYSHHSLGAWFSFFGLIHFLIWIAVLAVSVFVGRKVWDASASKKK